MINGTVVNSVLSPGVRVDVGAVVRDSIVMFDTVIRSGAVVDRAILDKEVVVGQGAIVGDGPDFDTPNKAEPSRLNTGITVVGKQSVIPRGVRLGRNVKVGEKVRSSDFAVADGPVGRDRRPQAGEPQGRRHRRRATGPDRRRGVGGGFEQASSVSGPGPGCGPSAAFGPGPGFARPPSRMHRVGRRQRVPVSTHPVGASARNRPRAAHPCAG